MFWFFCTVKNELNFFLSDIDQERNVDVKFILDEELVNVAIENDFFLWICFISVHAQTGAPPPFSPPSTGKILQYI